MDNIKKYQKLFSERLRALRNERGFKQEYLAEKLKISNTLMSRLENESAVPKFDVLINLSDIFNVSIDYLVGKSDNREIIGQILKQELPRQKAVVRSTVSKEAVPAERTKTQKERFVETVVGLSEVLTREFK